MCTSYYNSNLNRWPIAEEFAILLEKEIVACIIAGATHGFDVRISAVSEMGSMELQPRELFRDDISSDHLSSSEQGQGGYFADQFENVANFRAHYEGTGLEIWEQSGGKVDAVCHSCKNWWDDLWGCINLRSR